jgi:hypothetical protein
MSLTSITKVGLRNDVLTDAQHHYDEYFNKQHNTITG